MTVNEDNALANILKLTVDDDKQLIATIKPNKNTTSYTIEQIKKTITESEFGEYFIDEAQLSLLQQNLEQPEESTLKIGEAKDSEVIFDISANRMKAKVKIEKAQGGKTLDETSFIETIDKENIKHNHNEEALHQIFIDAHDDFQLLAEGQLPTAGKDAKFIYHFASEEQKISKNEYGTVNFLEKKDFTVVEKGTVLISKTLATPGTPGIDVTGKKIAATSGKDITFSSNCNGACINPDNPLQMIAMLKGHPIYFQNGVHVDPTLAFEHIDLSSGNIHFDGSVVVNGEVADGLTVEASGDIYVKGNINKATLIAGHNIICDAGVIGSLPENVESHQKNVTFNTTLEAGGTIKAKFVNLSKLVANTIEIKDYAYHCHCISDGSIVLGHEGGKGLLIGGLTFAKYSVTVNVIGNNSSIQSYIEVGELPIVKTAYNAKVKRLAIRKDEHSRLTNILEKVNETKTHKLGDVVLDKTKKIVETVKFLQDRIDALKDEVAQLESELKKAEKAHIRIKQKVFSNILFKINGQNHTTTNSHTVNGRYVMKNEKVLLDNS